MKKSIILFTFVLSQGVLAQSNTNTSTINTSKSWLKKIKPDRISHFSIVNGPAIDGKSNPYNFDGTENTDGPNSWHQVSFGYNLTKKTSFVINPRFVIERSETSENSSVGKLDNPVAGIQSTWYQNGNFTFSGGLNTVFAVFDETERERGLEWNPGGFQTMNYKINDYTNAGLWLWGRYRYYRNAPERSRFPLFVSPYVSYDINDKWNTMAFYQVNGANDNIDRFTWDPDEFASFAVGYRFNSALTISPMLTVYRESDFDIAQGNINVWISGRFL